MIKKVMVVFIIAALLLCNASGGFSEEVNTSRDETVYAMLKSDGSVDFIKVVSRLRGEGFSGKYSDETVGAEGLPVAFSFKYFIDKAEVTPDKLAGGSGEFRILISVRQNASCAEALKNKYMVQLQLPLNLSHARIKKFDGTTAVITGETETLSYTVMPGADADFELIFDAVDFEMDSMQIALVEYASGLSSQFGGLADGIHTMGEKAGELIDGTNELKAGMDKLSGGVSGLASAVTQVNDGSAALIKGMKDYSNGMKHYKTGLTAIAAGADSSDKGLKQLNESAAPILKGYEDLAGAAEQMADSHNELVKLARKLQNSKDPEIQALCSGIIAEGEGMEAVAAGLVQANQGLSGFTAGIGKIESGVGELNRGIGALPAGFDQLQSGYSGLQAGAGKLASGLSELEGGASELSSSVSGIPQNVQKLADGQVKFRDGIYEMEAGVKAGLGSDRKAGAVSFIDGNTKIDTLQFIIKTPELIKAKSEGTGVKTSEHDGSFVQRIWGRLVDLFKGKV